MPFLLISLSRAGTVEQARSMARRYSSMALWSVAVLVLAGICMAWFYIGTWRGLNGTSYGVLLLAKIYLPLLILLMGTGNWAVVRRLGHRSSAPAGAPAALCRGGGWVGIHRHSRRRVDVRATARSGCYRTGLAAGHCGAHASATSPHDEPSGVPADPAHFARNCGAGNRIPGHRRRGMTPQTSKWSEYNHHWAVCS